MTGPSAAMPEASTSFDRGAEPAAPFMPCLSRSFGSRRPSNSDGVSGCITAWADNSSPMRGVSPSRLDGKLSPDASPRATSPRRLDGESGAMSKKEFFGKSPLPYSDSSGMKSCLSRSGDRSPDRFMQAKGRPISVAPAIPTDNLQECDAGSASSPNPGPQVGLDKGLNAEDHIQCWEKASGIGSRKQRVTAPGTSDGLLDILSSWVTNVPVSSDGHLGRSPRTVAKVPTAKGRQRSQSPGRQEQPERPFHSLKSPGNTSPRAHQAGIPNVQHAVHCPDNVVIGQPLPAWFNQRSTFPRQHARARRPADEWHDIDTHQAVRCDKEYYRRSSSPPIGKNATIDHHVQGVTSTKKATSPRATQLEEDGFLKEMAPSESCDASSRGARFSFSSGPAEADFNAYRHTCQKRRLPVPGESPAEEAPAAEQLAQSGSNLARAPSPQARAAGISSPVPDGKRNGVSPRTGREDDIYTTKTMQACKVGPRRFVPRFQSSPGSTAPSHGSRGPVDFRDLAKGLSPEPSLLCWEQFLGDRRRKSLSPRASPGSSPWGSPTNSPRGSGTPARNESNLPGMELPSWNAEVSPSDGGIAEGVETKSKVPRWGADGPMLSAEERSAAVKLHRPETSCSLRSPVIVPNSIESKYRSREMTKTKVQANSKARWRG